MHLPTSQCHGLKKMEIIIQHMHSGLTVFCFVFFLLCCCHLFYLKFKVAFQFKVKKYK